MNANSEQLQQISALFSSTVQQVLIVLPSSAKADECATAVGWAEILRAQGKECKIVSPVAPVISSLEIPGSEEISQELGGDNLVVSFPYEQEKVDKVSYHIGEQTGRFYLTIKPKLGSKPLDLAGVELGYAGASADALVFIGVTTLEQIEPYASEYADLFKNSPGLSLVRNGEAEVGSVRLSCEGAASLSEESAHLCMQLGWELPVKAATALLRGIEFSTDWLASPTTTASTFEAVAALLRAGARRLRKPVETAVVSSMHRSSPPQQLPLQSSLSVNQPNLQSTTQTTTQSVATDVSSVTEPIRSTTPSYQPFSLADAMKQRQSEWGIEPKPSHQSSTASVQPTSIAQSISAEEGQENIVKQPTNSINLVPAPSSQSAPPTSSRSSSTSPTHHHKRGRRHRKHKTVTGYPGRKKSV